jgi:hypothetical protein
MTVRVKNYGLKRQWRPKGVWVLMLLICSACVDGNVRPASSYGRRRRILFRHKRIFSSLVSRILPDWEYPCAWLPSDNGWLRIWFIGIFIILCILRFNVHPAAEFYSVSDRKYLLFTLLCWFIFCYVINLFPVMMTWNARYIKKVPAIYEMWESKFFLVLTMLFGILVIVTEIAQQLGTLPPPYN